MDYEAYRKAFFVDPPPEPRFRFRGRFGPTLFYEDYVVAVGFYEQVLGPPSYVEGEGTWLTLLRGKKGNPRNVEITLELDTAREAEDLQRAFIAAGARGSEPSDRLMYRPLHCCPVVDPLGLPIMIVAPVADSRWG
jgi:hypothetical protein